MPELPTFCGQRLVAKDDTGHLAPERVFFAILDTGDCRFRRHRDIFIPLKVRFAHDEDGHAENGIGTVVASDPRFEENVLVLVLPETV